MTKKTKHLGRESGANSGRWFQPQSPQTGDGKTRRFILDAIEVVFKKGSKKQK